MVSCDVLWKKGTEGTGKPGMQGMERNTVCDKESGLPPIPHPARDPGLAAGTLSSKMLLWLRPQTQPCICMQRIWAGGGVLKPQTEAAWDVKPDEPGFKAQLRLFREPLLSEPQFPHLQHGRNAKHSADISFFPVQLFPPCSSTPSSLSFK